jgi:drug/metabolite transporter (DMT)-like permease
MGIFFGLLAAIGWGIADFLMTNVTRRVGSAQSLVYIQSAGLLAIVLVMVFQFQVPTASLLVWIATLGLGLINLLGTVLIYRSYAVGTLALVSPISSGFAIVTALLALASGERPSVVALIGALLLIVGVVVVSRGNDRPSTSEVGLETGIIRAPRRSLHLPPGVPEALGVAICFGVYFWGLDYVTPTLGHLWPILLSRGVAVCGVLAALARQRLPVVSIPSRLWPFVLGTAVMDTVAFLAFNVGLGTAETSIVTALAALFSAVTVLLAWAILRERLSPGQLAGVGVILVGVLLVSV